MFAPVEIFRATVVSTLWHSSLRVGSSFDTRAKHARVFQLSKYFNVRLMFAYNAGAYPSGNFMVPKSMRKLQALLVNIRLS